MGNKASQSLYKDSEIRILVIGRYSPGRTTAIYQMKLSEMGTACIPPPFSDAGLNFEEIDVNGVKMTAWDVGVRGATRPILRYYAAEVTDAIVLVVNSGGDEDELEDVDELLQDVLIGDKKHRTPLLVLANKQDKPEAKTVVEITERLGLNKIRDRQWNIVPTCATTGDGVKDGFEWLSKAISGKLFTDDIKDSLNTSVTEVKNASGKFSQNAWWQTNNVFKKTSELFKFMTGCGGSK